MLWDTYAIALLFDFAFDNIFQTAFLPENDQNSINLMQYKAQIDVSLGGRVAEELSE